MAEIVDAKAKTLLEDYRKALHFLLGDHTRNFGDDPRLFHATYFNRGQERNRFWGLLSSSNDPDRTVIITGGAGVGKTSFVYNLVFGPDGKSIPKILPIMADFRSAVPQNLEGCLMGFVQNAKTQFQSTNLSLDGLRDNTLDNIGQNVRFIHHCIKLLASAPDSPRALIFLDDFDYAEQEWFKLLDHFLPFVQSSHCGVVLTMRPRLYAAIQSYDERLRFYFGRNVQQIHLNPMPAREVLASRLAPLLVERASKSVLSSIIAQFKREDRLGRVVSQLGLRNFRELPEIDFPFTEKHNDFMHRITNGNLREVQDIAIDSLLFILQEGDRLEVREENGFKRSIIGRQNVLDLFYERDAAHFKIIDINKNRSASGNSLLYNVLEALKIDCQVNNRMLRQLQSFGHSEQDVRWAINHLSDRTQRLLEAKWVLPRDRASTLLRAEEYEVTEKGNYYLDIATWPEYQRRAGSFGKSVIEATKV